MGCAAVRGGGWWRSAFSAAINACSDVEERRFSAAYSIPL